MGQLSYKKLNRPKGLISTNFLLNNYYPITNFIRVYEIKTNSKYRVPGPRPAPIGYIEPEPVKPGTHGYRVRQNSNQNWNRRQSGPFFFWTGPRWIGSGPDESMPGSGLDPTSPCRDRVWVLEISAHPYCKVSLSFATFHTYKR